MRRYSVMYFISQAFKGLWRNGVMTLASVVVLFSCLVVMGTFGLLVVNINTNLASLGGLNEIVAFVELDKTDEETEQIGEQIKTYENIKDVTFVSKDDAFAEEKAKYEEEYPSFFDGVTSDIYPAAYVISYEDNVEVHELEIKLKDTEGIYKVNCRSDVAEKIENVKQGVIYVCIWFLAILFVVSVFEIMNTIKLAVFARRQEISYMRYVGATNTFIMVPFIIEGGIIGLISSGLAFLAEYNIYKMAYSKVAADFSMISIVKFSDVGSMLLLAFVVIGIVTGIIGSCISLRKNLNA